MSTEFFSSFDKARPVVVALSGGVDSAVAAALAVEAGLSVVGITMRLYDASGTAASSGGKGGDGNRSKGSIVSRRLTPRK